MPCLVSVYDCLRSWCNPASIAHRPCTERKPDVHEYYYQKFLNKTGSFKVCVCGGAGGIGQPLSMLMAANKHVSELCVFDLTIAMVPAEGVAADLSHIERKSKVTGYALDKDDKPIEKLQECLTGCHLVLVPAGLPRKPGMTRADLLGTNAGIAKNIVEACAKFCPDAILGLIVNPVNSVVPAMCELYKQAGFDPRKICGVTSLDIVRANKFVHEATGAPIESIDVPVVGGHAGSTILPLFSQVPAAAKLPGNQLKDMDKHVQDAGTDVVNAKGGKGSATLSMAYAGAKFGNAVLCGLAGDETTECAYVMRGSGEELPYLASKVTFGEHGVKEVHGLGPMSDYESERFRECLKQLKEEITAGLDYAKSATLGCNNANGSKAIAPPAKPAPPPPLKVTSQPANQGNFKVCVCGGAGGIGQPLCLLMAQNPHVKELCVFDLTLAMVPAQGVATDLSHLEKKSIVKGYALDKDDKPMEKLGECLKGCDLVLVPAGMPRKPGMTRADLLGINAGIAKNIVEACAKHCPDAVLGLIVNPVNSVVPAMCELYKKAGLDPKKICGVTSLDIVRANKFVHEATGQGLESIDVPVVGGHAGVTILPLFSQVPAMSGMSAEKVNAMDKHVQDAGTDVVNAKGGKGSATLSMAYAGAKFGNAVLCGLAGVETTECAYVAREAGDELPYLASKVTFGKGGVQRVHAIGNLNAHEQTRWKECIGALKDEIEAGISYAKTERLNV